jgi:thiamine transport system permease protein
VTALARHISDPDRSLARQLNVRSLPASARMVVALAAAATLLWPLARLAVDLGSGGAWSGAVFTATWFSIAQAVIAAAAGVALSIPIGWSLARLAVPARRLVRALLTAPVALPALGIALGMSWLLPDQWTLLLVAHSGFGLAVGVRLGGSAWLALDPREAETARTLGLNDLQVVRWHLVPALGRSYLAAWALASALALGAVGTPLLLATASRSTLSQLAGATAGGEIAAPAAGATLILLVTLAAALVVFIRCRPDHERPAGAPEFQPLGGVAVRERLLLAAAFTLAALVVLAPLFALFHGAVTIGATEQVTGAHLAALFEAARPFEVEVVPAVQRSLVLALVASLIALPVGFMLALLVAPLRGWTATVAEVALFLPLFLAVSVAAGLRSAGLDSAVWLLFVHLGIAVPLVIRVVLPGVRSRMHSQFEAATLLGASPWASWNRLASRSIRGQLVVAAGLTFAWSVGEVGAALLLQRLDATPASAAIVHSLEQQSAAADGRAFALGAALALLVTILFVTIEYRRSREITEF